MSVVTYLDFYIEVTELNAPEYQIRVRSKAGEARADISFPYTNAQLDAELVRLESAILYVHTQTRRLLPPHEEAVRKLGIRFFEFLLPNDNGVRSLYYECQKLAEFEGKGVRLNLLIRSPYLSTLPWEFIYDPRTADYLALDPFTPLVRYPEIAQSTSPLLVTPPLRILGLVANPKDLTWIDVDAEKQQIQEALQSLIERRLIELIWLPDQTWRKLQQWMRPNYGPWHIFHFIGHGEFDLHRDEGRIFLTGDDGRSKGISATELGRLLRFQRGTLRLALLNACEGARGGKLDVLSSTAATLVLGGLPAALAMQYAISDAAAIEFARTFYESLTDGLPIDAAMSEARKAISFTMANTLEWGTPVLYLRASDGRLFDIERQHGNSRSDGLTGYSVKLSQQNLPKVDIVMEQEDVAASSKSELETATTIEQSPQEESFQHFDEYWRNSFLPTVRKQHGVRVEAALRAVKDVAVFQDKIIVAFGSNEFTHNIIAEPEINNKLATLLSKFLKRSVKLECQLGERAHLNVINGVDPLLRYPTPTLEMKGQSETSSEIIDKNLEDIWKRITNEAVTIEQPLDVALVKKLNDHWRETFLPTVRKECGVPIEAALRGVRDIAIFQDSIAFAFGSNNFTRDLIAEPETNSKIAAILSRILGRAIKLKCQLGEQAQLFDPLVHYAITKLGAKLIRQTAI